MPLPYSLENHTRIQTKMGKVYSPFRPKRRKNHTLWGGTYPQGKYIEDITRWREDMNFMFEWQEQ